MRILTKSRIAGLLCLPALACAQSVVINVDHDGAKIVVDGTMHTDASPAVAWAVLTDYGHMAQFIPDLDLSEINEHHGDTLHVHQRGSAHYGLFNFSFESFREVALLPMVEIRSRGTGGNVEKLEGTTRLSPEGSGTLISYHSISVPDFWVPASLSNEVVRHEVTEQFQNMLEEMKRRKGRLQDAPLHSASAPTSP